MFELRLERIRPDDVDSMNPGFLVWGCWHQRFEDKEWKSTGSKAPPSFSGGCVLLGPRWSFEVEWRVRMITVIRCDLRHVWANAELEQLVMLTGSLGIMDVVKKQRRWRVGDSRRG
jgi:hypothetical protein